ncbi:alpha-N-acetylglucosaminidase C-terminal domain-containing protein [Streptomyces canus]|uniref:alpha-N-acetylglucosaminidase n=1 Tax=Streptomyces canus TaxID=58343 RepID=UPI00225365FF|nr:alpha-N-acetylglucosaminidase [Streptomyces canus]MCX4852522.1 alpha-N-acetylglucosaminidase C-terminal domain-containing protein [Streptomyces canus]WSW32271.1 alpha-N-acetylglucosaminidase C-terminal domain-containing protein [Streptomyces canus]
MHDNRGDLDLPGVTRRRILTGAVALGGAALLARPQGAYAAGGALFDTAPAAAAVKRLLPDHYRQLTLRAVTDVADRFRVTGRAGQITVEGTSPAVLLAGLHTYLRRTAHASVSWTGEQLNLPRTLPAPAAAITGTANVPHRFAFNDTNEGYTGAYRDWDAWQYELDVLAVHGVNRVLIYMGGDAVYYDTFRQFGYTDAEMRAWIPAPAHQPWWLLQNMSGFGGPVSRQLIEKRAALAEKIIDRVRDLGMTPVLPGYYGSVPDDFPARHGGDAAVVAQGTWGAFKRPDWLDPRTTAFADVAAAFYRAQKERFGGSTMYKMDLLHEGGNAGDVPVGEAAGAVEAALQKAHPGAVWAILGWQNNPAKELLDGVDKSRMLIVDGLSDRYTTVTDRESDWGGTPYAFGSIWNFGGHTPIGANAPDWVEQYPKWRDREGSSLAGIAAMPEGADNNAPALALLTDLAWTPGTVDLDDWFAAYALSRYGGPDRHAAAAWQTIRDTAYNMSRADSWSEAPDGLFGARPSLTANKAAAWGPEKDRYDTTAFDAALTELLAVRAELRDSSAYRYDVVDVARQVLSNRSRVLLPQIKAAHDAGDKALFGKLTKTWLGWMDLLDDLLATSGPHLLGRWLADARSWGADRAEKDRLEYDVRSLITTWGGRESSEEGLHDYANREWSGLVGGLYRTRWQTYFNALTTGKDPSTIDWFALEDRWAHAHETHATDPHGSPYALARSVRDLLATTPYQAALTAGVDRGAVAEGTPATVTVTFTNRNGFTAARGVTLSVTAPEGMAVKPLDPVSTASVASGETFAARFEVSLAGAPSELVGQVVAAAAYAGGGKVVAPVRLMAAAGVGDPYRTASYNDAVFGQAGDEIAIEGAGADLWGGTNEFGAVYRAGGYKDGTVAQVTVTSQDASGGWARAGIIVRNDLGTQGTAGYVNLAITPSNGCALSWDADGDGRFDSIELSGSFTAPVRLRLTRSGASYTGEASTDGVTWTTVGTATPSGAAAAQDVGVFMTAANGWTDGRGIATFDGFTVT